jgi:alcohol-forming fatty acyl-CoA reductase
MEVGRGTLTSVLGVEDYNVDLIPVDTVCNTLITAAWANSFSRLNSIPVYNCTSGQMNPQTWGEMGTSLLKYSRKNPSKYVMMNPTVSYRTNRFMHWLYEIVLHFLPALAFDLMLRVQGKKPFMMKIAKRFKMAADVGSYFVLHEWNFENKNVQRIIRAARETQLDAQEFDCDLQNLDWDTYIEKYMMGIRTFVLKDSVKTLPLARKRLQAIVWTKRVVQLVLIFVFYIILFYGFWK